MNLKAGIFLKSLPAIGDPVFEEVVIFITEYNAQGTLGFVINKKFPRVLNDLEEFKHLPSFPLYEGGPVDQQHLFFIHRRTDLVPGGIPIIDNIVLGGDFKKAISHLAPGTLSTAEIKIFIGYCGWEQGQLELEIEEGSWQIMQACDPFVNTG